VSAPRSARLGLLLLDVDGIRLVIETTWSPASPTEDMAEMRAILDSIRIEPSPS